MVLLIANSGSSGIGRFDARTGEFLGALIPPDSARLPFPDTILEGADGTLYISAGCRTTPDVVCDRSISVIQKYDRTGAFLGTFTSAAQSPVYRPYGMAFGPDGLLYVASFMNNQILRYDGAGNFVDVFAAQEPGDPTGLNGPNGLLFDGAALYVTTEGSVPVNGAPTFPDGFRSVILRYDVETRERTVFADPPDQGGTPPSLEGLRLGPDGRLYASDFDLNVVHVYELAGGKEVRQLSTAEPSLANQYTGEIVFDASGALLVTVGSQKDPILGAVLQFSGRHHERREVLVPPTVLLDRPGGIVVV